MPLDRSADDRQGGGDAEWAAVDPRAVLAALEDVADPEIPTVSVVELGMVERIEVRPESISVELLPTFVGCPAVEVIRESVASRLASFGRPVFVEMTFSTPWTSDRISPAGREKLRRSGFAPPPHVDDRAPRATSFGRDADRAGLAGRSLTVLDDRLAQPAAVECPYCGSTETTLENVFGPTQCRSIRHCAACRQPFESFKPV